MKKYRLKQLYPSLSRRVEKNDIATFDGSHYRIVKEFQQYEDCGLTEGWYHFEKEEVENNPDFWELIEEEKPKPLFITDDGVEIFEGDKTIPVDVRTWKKHFAEVNNGLYERFKYFFHESNADEYILRNKRLFTFEEMKKANIDINWCTEDIYYKAKERIEE